MGKLLQLITKLFGKNALSKTLGTRTNVIKLPSNEKKRLIKDELNIEAASDLAAQKILKEAEDLIADIPRMNDQEVLTFTGNLQRLDNKLNPPSAEVLDITTKQPVTKEGIEQLAASQKSPVMARIEETLKDLQMNNPYRPGGALDPQMGIVRTAARQVLQKLAREGKIKIADPREEKAIIEGYQGGVDPIDVFRKTFGQEALGDLSNLGDELLEIDNRGGSFKELKKILEDEGFFDLQQPKNPAQGMTDEELMKKIMDEDPEEFARGGRVGFDQGGPTDKGILSLEEAKELNPTLFMDTTTYNPIPEDADRQAAAEIAKVIMGTLGMDDDMTSRTFVFEEYVVPKRKDMMENYGLTLKEADDLIREEMEKFRTNKAIGGRVGFQKGTSKIFDQLEMNVPHPYGHRVDYQIGGDVAYDATNPIYGSSAITVTPNTIMGPKGNQIQAQTGVNPVLQRIQNAQNAPSASETLGRLYNKEGINEAQSKFLLEAAKSDPGIYEKTGTGFLSDLRHKTAAAQLRDTLGGGIMGKIAANVLGGIREVPQLLTGDFKGVGEDLKANYLGAKNIPVGLTPKESYDYLIAEKKAKEATPSNVSGQLNLEDFNKPASLPNSSPSNLNNLLSLFERYKDIQTPTPADPESGFVGETALGNIEKGIKNFLGSNKGFKYGKDISSDIDDIYSFIEAERRSFSPDLSQNYYGGDLYNYLQDFYDYKYGNPRIDNFGFSGREDVFKSYFNKPYKFGLASGGRVGYAYGSGLKLVQILTKLGKDLKKEIKKAVDDLIPSGDPKLDADMAVDNMLEDLNIDRETLDQYDILDAYGMAYDELKQPLLKQIKNKPKPFTGKLSDDFDGDTSSLIKELESVGLSKNAERLRLKQKYPGIDDDLLTRIIEDKDPQHKALVLAELDNAMELMKRDISSEEVVDILKQTSRTKNSKGGLNYLSGF